MIVQTKIDPTKVLTYHETGKASDKEEKITRIKSTADYTSLKTSLETEGQFDPVVVRCEPDRVYIEVGERRVLAARDAGIRELDAIAYSTNGRKDVPFTGTNLDSKTNALKAFSRDTLTVTRSGICPECGHDHGSTTEEVEVPSRKTIREYIDAGIAHPESENQVGIK